ncbi:COX15/CtaA family protein [Gammaproteobacteria bacterium]|nr:COX15/CtaA family protein [Gammaproteobacteria bacterium]
MKALKVVLFCFALLVIGFGAYTRLKDAGLGCPDWPGCYGYALYPKTPHAIIQANLDHPSRPFEEEKAWPEMYHRYLAGLLGIGIAYLAIRNLRAKKHLTSSYLILGVLLFQGLLGAWTVTMLLHPLIVLAHLIGGFSIATLLFYQLLPQPVLFGMNLNTSIVTLLFLQILLGGWTSTNYAALICTDFPSCQGTLLPPLYLKEAFWTSLPIGQLYEYGILSNEARVTIQTLHRYIALIILISIPTVIYLQRAYYTTLKSSLPLCILLFQIILGIGNIIFLLPISTAVLHNLFALCLLLSWLWYAQKPTSKPI